MRDAFRAVVWGVVGGLIVAAILLVIGARDPLTLVLVSLAAALLVGVTFELYQVETASRHLPHVRIGLGSLRPPNRESDDALAGRVEALVTGITGLMGTHIRNQPDMHSGGGTIDIQAWEEQTNRRARHDSNTAARFFEQYGGDVLATAQALRQRNVISEEEHRHLIWTMQTGSYGGSLIHDLPTIAAQLAAASRKLRGQD